MRPPWETVRRDLRRTVHDPVLTQHYSAAVPRCSILKQFESPAALVDYLIGPDRDLDTKDRIYRALVQLTQANRDAAPVAMAVVVLGLWPALNRARRREVARQGDPARVAGEVTSCIARRVAEIDLRNVTKVASTLARNTIRDVREAFVGPPRSRTHAELPPDEELLDPRTGDIRGPSDLGLAPGLSPDRQLEELRLELRREVGGNADLVLGAAVYGIPRRELASHIGISHDAARKRYQRALARLRRRLQEIDTG